MKLTSAAPFILLLFFAGSAIAQVATPQVNEPQLPRQSATPLPTPSPATRGTGSSENPFLGGVPSGKAQPETLDFSLRDAIHRGLQHNLGLLLAEQATRGARGAWWRAMSDLLPNLTTRTSISREQLNLKSFGFPGIPGIPNIVGPFDVFDTRAFLTQPLLDLKALYNTRAESQNQMAANFAYRDAHDVVVLVSASLYLQAVAGESRIEAAQAQLKAAQALYDLAVDLKKAGVVPGIDVLRSQVELQAQQQRLIFFQNEFEKEKLNLARAIGLPIGQKFRLTDRIPYAPLPPWPLEEALGRAYRSRADYQRAITLLRAAESAKKSARGEGLPSLRINADYGDIGPTPGQSHGTFSVAANVAIPIFLGGRVHGNVLEADALLQQRKSELEDLRSRIDYEVRTVFLDLKASSDQVQVATSALALAKEQLQQSQDRFAAGVATSIEVVQAQESLATANENYISSLYAYNVAEASLARALGGTAELFEQLLGGSHK